MTGGWQDWKEVKALQLQVSCHLQPLLWLWDMDSACWLWKKGPRLLKPSAWKNFSFSVCISYLEHKTGRKARSTSLWVHRNLFRQLSRNGNLHGSGRLHATTASLKPSFRAPWRVGDAMVSRGNARWTSKSGHPCQCQNCSQRPSAEKTGKGSLLNHPSCPPPFSQPSQSRDWTELNSVWGLTDCCPLPGMRYIYTYTRAEALWNGSLKKNNRASTSEVIFHDLSDVINMPKHSTSQKY